MSGGARVTSSPRKRTRPEVARSSPDSKLRRVDLPAPFGPMMACTVPRSTRRVTPSTAASAPKRRVSPSVSRSTSATAALQEPGDPAREEEDDRDQGRAERRPVEGPFPSQEHGHQDQPGLAPAELRGIHEAVQGGVEISRQPGE